VRSTQYREQLHTDESTEIIEFAALSRCVARLVESTVVINGVIANI